MFVSLTEETGYRAGFVDAEWEGRMSVREAMSPYEHRRRGSSAAGRRVDGVDGLLERLSGRPGEELVVTAGFVGASESFVSFLDTTGAAAGCVHVEGEPS